MKKKVQALKNKKNFFQKNLASYLLAGVIGFLILTFIGYHLAYWHHIYPGVKVLGQNLGNQSEIQATENLNRYLASIEPKLILKNEEQTWTVDLQKIEFTLKPELTVKKAYQVGREGKAFVDFENKVKAWLGKINLNMDYGFNQSLFDEQVATVAAQVYIPAVEPTIKITDASSVSEKSRIQIEPGKDGQEADKRKLLSIIHSQLSLLNFDAIQLPLIYISPTLNSEQVENTRQRAEKFLNKKIILTDGQNNWELQEKELINFLSFTNGFDQDKISSWSANLAAIINHPPENAAFQFSEGRVTEFRPAKQGEELDQKKTIDLIAQNLKKIEEGEKGVTLNLPIKSTQPKVKTADVNNLGIKELIGQGVSFFKGSIQNRIHNIELASSRLNGLLIPPGETFSFNKALGDVSQSTGYQEAYIIKEGRTVLGDGGGVCQVSTTLFRAALNAGLPILERQAHAYRVSYYEQNSEVGLDATVFDPTADLKIKNDTPGHLLIQTQVDLKNSRLTFELYGTNDGRKSSLSKSRIWNQVPPPPDLYQDDPTLPPGITKQIDWKAWGAKVAFDYKVERNGEILQNRTFYSNYRPWQAIFLKGPTSP